MHGPAARFGRGREGLAIQDGVGDGLRAIVGDALLSCRRKIGADADRDSGNRHRHRRGQCVEAGARPAPRGLPYALDELDRLGERNLACPRAVPVATHRPRPFVVMRVRGQSPVRQVDLAAIEERAARCDGNEHRRVSVLGDADGRRSING